jgi:integrase
MPNAKNTKHRVQIRRPTKGINVSEYFDTKRGADAFRRKMESAIESGEPIAQNVRSRETFDDAVTAYLTDDTAFTTRKGRALKPSYERDRRERLKWLKALFGPVVLKHLTWNHIDETLAHRSKLLGWKSTRTRYQYEVALSRLFDYCRRKGWVAVNVIAGKDRLNDTEQRRRTYTEKEWKSLLGKADACNDMLGTFLRLAWETGARKSEVLRLRWVDVEPVKIADHPDLAARIELRDTKSGEDRVVFISRALFKRLKAHEREYRRPTSPLVFPSRTRNGRYNADGPFRVARTAAKLDQPDEKYGEVLNIHHIRHTWATRLGDRGASLAQIMSAGGWKTAQMAMRYMKRKESQAMEAASLLHH